MEMSADGHRTTNANIDQRVARVEADLGHLSDRFDSLRTLMDERFANMGKALDRIESAVTAPNAADGQTAQMLTDLSRRITDQETGARNREGRLTSLESQVGTVGSVLRWVGLGSILTIVGLVAFAITQTGRPL